MDQRSVEWIEARLGHATGSRASDMLAGKDTQARKGYITQLVTERLTGMSQDFYTNADMQRGIEVEPVARAAYQANHELVDEVGFIKHPTILWFGASPDGLVGEDGLIEIKCPNSATHWEYFKTKEPPKKYWIQMQAQMSVTDRKWCDFVSFDPRMPERSQLLVVHVPRDPESYFWESPFGYGSTSYFIKLCINFFWRLSP